MAGIGITPTAHFIITALALLLPLYIAYQALPADQIEHVSSKQYFAIAHGPLVALGIIGFCGAVAEGSIADWSGVSKGTIANYERGARTPFAPNLAALRRAFEEHGVVFLDAGEGHGIGVALAVTT